MSQSSSVVPVLCRLGLFAAVVALVACGGAKPEPATAKPPEPTGCAPGSDNAPSDARDRMTELQSSVRKCYAMAATSAETDVKVEVTVAASGDVRDARVVGSLGDPSAVDCLKKTIGGAKFGKFCGPDVSISWTYAVR